jgi:hypothetical protein
MRGFYLACMCLCYALPIGAVSMVYDRQRHASISAVLCDEWVWKWAMLGILSLSFFTILYEGCRMSSPTSFYSILVLLTSLVLMLDHPVNENEDTHYFFALVVLGSILVWVYTNAPVISYMQCTVLVGMALLPSSHFFHAEVAFLALFAVAYVRNHGDA